MVLLCVIVVSVVVLTGNTMKLTCDEGYVLVDTGIKTNHTILTSLTDPKYTMCEVKVMDITHTFIASNGSTLSVFKLGKIDVTRMSHHSLPPRPDGTNIHRITYSNITTHKPHRIIGNPLFIIVIFTYVIGVFVVNYVYRRITKTKKRENNG